MTSSNYSRNYGRKDFNKSAHSIHNDSLDASNDGQYTDFKFSTLPRHRKEIHPKKKLRKRRGLKGEARSRATQNRQYSADQSEVPVHLKTTFCQEVRLNKIQEEKRS
jgi:hypothetical protein